MSTDIYSSYADIPSYSLEAMQDQTMLLIGCGALGSHVAESAAAQGVGRIVLCDFDTLQPHNLPRTACVSNADIGRLKVEAVSDALRRRFGTAVQVIPIAGWAQTILGAGVFRRCTCVMLCPDNRSARLWAARHAEASGVPYINGGIQEWFGTVTAFGPPDSPCYACTLSDAEMDSLDARYSCGSSGDRAVSIPTTQVAASMTAAMMIHSLVRIVHGDGSFLGQRIFINPVRGAISTAAWQRKPECSCSVKTPTPEPMPINASGDEFTPRELIRLAQNDCGQDARVALGFGLVSEDSCPKCGRIAHDPPRHEHAAALCPSCGSGLVPQMLTSVIGPDHPWADHTFRDLRAPFLADIIVVGSRGTRTYELSGDAVALGLEDRR